MLKKDLHSTISITVPPLSKSRLLQKLLEEKVGKDRLRDDYFKMYTVIKLIEDKKQGRDEARDELLFSGYVSLGAGGGFMGFLGEDVQIDNCKFIVLTENWLFFLRENWAAWNFNDDEEKLRNFVEQRDPEEMVRELR